MVIRPPSGVTAVCLVSAFAIEYFQRSVPFFVPRIGYASKRVVRYVNLKGRCCGFLSHQRRDIAEPPRCSVLSCVDSEHNRLDSTPIVLR